MVFTLSSPWCSDCPFEFDVKTPARLEKSSFSHVGLSHGHAASKDWIMSPAKRWEKPLDKLAVRSCTI